MRIEARFGGSVQGVGFRYTTARIASGYDVTGFVQNLRDGNVLLVLEGERAAVDGCLRDVRETMAHYIGTVASVESPATGEFDAFDIRT